MNKDFGQNDPQIAQYALETFRPEDSTLKEIRERTARTDIPQIQVGSMDVLHLEVIVRATGARKAVEIGTLAGYSGVSLVRGLGPQGKLYTFEYNTRHADEARESFRNAGVLSQVEIFTGSALDNLPKIEQHGPFDLVFIDADKLNYPNYLHWAIENVRVGGLILGDNTFAFGCITDTTFEDAELEQSVRSIREYNRIAATSDRLRSTILPTSEGLTVSVKVR